MINVLNKFRKRNIQTNLPHFILVIFVIAVSVCLITGLFISHLTLKSSVENFYKESNLPSLWIETSGVTSEDEEFFSKFDYSKRYSFESDISVGNSKYNSKFLVSDGEVSRPYLVEGEKGKGCYVDSKFAQKHNIGVNYSKVQFDYTIDGKTCKLSFKVLGTLSLAEDLVSDDDCLIFIDDEYFLEELNAQFSDVINEGLSIDYNQILITTDVSPEDIDSIRNYYDNYSSETLKSIKTQAEIKSFQAVAEEIRISSLMLCIFPLLFIIVSVLVVVSSIVDLVARESYNIGLLKTFGIKNNKILSNYCGYGVFICLFGAGLGILLAPLVIPNMTFETYDLILNLPRDEVKMIVPAWLIFAIILSAILLGYFSAFFVCFNLVRKTPKECMSGIKKIKKKKRSKSFGKIGSAFRSMKNNLARTTMSIFGISGCLLLTIMGFGVKGIKTKFLTLSGTSIEVFSRIFQIFSMVILLLTIIILITQIFREKSKEMAMLRIHGESCVKIWLSLLLEMLIIGAIGFIIAGLFAQPVFILLLRLFEIKAIIGLGFWGFFKAFLLAFGLILIVASIGLIKIYKLNLSDATKLSE